MAKARHRLSILLEDPVFSSLYETEPVGYQEQPWFLNQVCLGKTTEYPLELLFKLKAIEQELGRVPGPRFGPRTLDLDLIFFADWVFQSEILTIPHPRMLERSFVIRPLLEINDDWIDPRSGESLRRVWDENREQFSRCYLYL
ncbi:MAG: 2-amino-4-hydroxy-6-hydroxymethyldihydropteridine diphosphokinase [Firmicutes bacterium]|nr:2-amino-4-hydroxy-6-hydroxymethyldihydropteridine diphosphokinase [Bacillota bacterium]